MTWTWTREDIPALKLEVPVVPHFLADLNMIQTGTLIVKRCSLVSSLICIWCCGKRVGSKWHSFNLKVKRSSRALDFEVDHDYVSACMSFLLGQHTTLTKPCTFSLIYYIPTQAGFMEQEMRMGVRVPDNGRTEGIYLRVIQYMDLLNLFS